MGLIYNFGTRDNKNDHTRVLIYSCVVILFWVPFEGFA